MHKTGRFRAVGYDFAVEASDVIVDFLDDAFSGLVCDGNPTHLYTIVSDDEISRLLVNGSIVVEDADPSRPLAFLMWSVNRHAAETPGLAILHAAAAAIDGRAVILPAHMESGKSTLVAGLASAGLQYLTDELTTIDPETLAIRPYAKPIALDPGSWPVLPALEPDVEPRMRPYLPAQWYIPPSHFGAHVVPPQADPVLVVFPRYRPNEPPELARITPADALAEAASCALSMARDPELTLTTLGRVIERCECFRLTVSQLSGAVDTVVRTLQRASTRPVPQVST